MGHPSLEGNLHVVSGILEYEHQKELDHPQEVLYMIIWCHQKSITRVRHEAEEFQSTTGCLFHTDSLSQAQNVSYFSIHLSIPSIFN